MRFARVLRLFAGDSKSLAPKLRAAAGGSAPPLSDKTAQTRGGAISDYYSRKQLKHARNAALVALTWAAVAILTVVYCVVTK